EWYLRLVWRPADLIVGDDALGCQDHLVGGHRQIDVHELQPIDLRIAVGVAPLDVNQGDVGIKRGNEQQLLAGKRAIDFDRLWTLLLHIRPQHRSNRHEWNAHGPGAESHAHGHVAPLVVPRFSGLHVVAHHFRDAPQDSLTEPARHDAIADTGCQQQVAVAGDDAARAGQSLSAGADERPDHPNGSARHGAAADADRIPVAHERGRLLHLTYLVAHAP